MKFITLLSLLISLSLFAKDYSFKKSSFDYNKGVYMHVTCGEEGKEFGFSMNLDRGYVSPDFYKSEFFKYTETFNLEKSEISSGGNIKISARVPDQHYVYWGTSIKLSLVNVRPIGKSLNEMCHAYEYKMNVKVIETDDYDYVIFEKNYKCEGSVNL